MLVLGACGPAHHQLPDESRSPTDDLSPALRLPPGAAAAKALATLASARPSCDGLWLRSRYLLDLFDWVRLLPSETGPGLEMLWSGCALEGKPARGRIATDQVLAALEGLLRQTATRCKAGLERELASHAASGLALLAADRASRAGPAAALQVAVAYRRIIRGGSPFAENARLRLVDWCAEAFRLAAGGDPRDQQLRLDYCLFPLFPADPSPYFSDDPAERPPDPPWTVLREALVRARDGLKGSRLAPLVERLAVQHRRFFTEAAPLLPAPLRLSSLDLPRLEGGHAWDRTPIVAVHPKGYVVDGLAVLEENERALELAVAARLHNDERRHITLVAERTVLASRLLDLGRLARKAGATTMGLAGVREVARPTRGDVQSLVFGDKPVVRLEEITVSLDLLAAVEDSGPARSLPRGLIFDPRTAEGQLALSVGRDGVQVMSRDGRLGPVSVRDLPAQLAVIRKVYPEDRSIVVAPDGATTYEDLLAVVAAARRHDGQPLFPGAALAQPSRLTQPAEELAPVLRLLAGAKVEAEPQRNRSWPALARRCYLETLRKFVGNGKRPPEGTLRIGVTRQGPRIRGGTLRHPGLRRCVRQRLSTVPLPPSPQPVVLTFTR